MRHDERDLQARWVVRRALCNEADLALVVPLFDGYRQVFGQPSEMRRCSAFIRERLRNRDSVILIASSPESARDTAAGFLQLFPLFSSLQVARVWMVNDLFVTPAARRAGAGQSLMEAARSHAIRTGAKKLVLKTDVGNRGAQTLYESLGYKCENNIASFYALELA